MAKVSVVLATYNGASYISDQLESLVQQTVLPDEVLIVDDCSSDGTVAIVKSFIEDNELKDWHVAVNKRNKGWMQNFIDSMCLAKGDYICPCDQDDIWFPTHIEHLKATIEATRAGVVSSLPKYVHSVSEMMSPIRQSCASGFEYPSFTCRFHVISQPGCTFIVDRRFFEQIKQFWNPGLPHDAFLYATAKMLGMLVVLNTETLLFRRHGNNASNLNTKNRGGLLGELSYNETLYRSLWSVAECYIGDDDVSNAFQVLNRFAEWCEKRRHMVEARSVLEWLSMGKYADCYASQRNYLADLWCIAFKELRFRR